MVERAEHSHHDDNRVLRKSENARFFKTSTANSIMQMGICFCNKQKTNNSVTLFVIWFTSRINEENKQILRN